MHRTRMDVPGDRLIESLCGGTIASPSVPRTVTASHQRKVITSP